MRFSYCSEGPNRGGAPQAAAPEQGQVCSWAEVLGEPALTATVLLGQSPRAPPSHPPWFPLGEDSTFARNARIRRRRPRFAGGEDDSSFWASMCMFMAA